MTHRTIKIHFYFSIPLSLLSMYLTNGGVGYEKTDLIPKDLVEYIDNKFSGIEK